MSLRDCILRAKAAGEMDPDRADEAAALFDELERDYGRRMNGAEARRRAAADTIDQVERETIEKARRDRLQIRAQQRIQADMAGYRTARGREDFGEAMKAHLDPDESATFSNVFKRKEVVLGRLQSRMAALLQAQRRTVTGGVRNPARMRSIVRELLGEDTGDASARELAGGFAEAAELARLRFNQAGGRIPKLEKWGLPQSHDSLTVRKAGFEAWRDEIWPRLDRAAMIDRRTGQPFSDEALELALRDAYDQIATEGWARATPSAGGGGRALANRRLDHRFLIFRSADDWMAYQDRFGEADPFSAMVTHLDSMARDIAMMEILGPNPSATLRWMDQVTMKRAAERDAAEGGGRHTDRARAAGKAARAMYDHIRGQTNAPIDGRVARSFAGTRSFLQAAQLGSAAISAITDLNFQRIAAAHVGMPQGRVAKRVARMLANPEDRVQAVRAGLIAENWSTVALGQQRYVGEVTGPEFGRRLSDAVMNLSGLSPWTQAGRWAFGMELMGFLADEAGKRFDDLRAPTRDTLRRYGIGPDKWERVRETALYEYDGATLLRPDDIAVREDLTPDDADDLANRLMEMIRTETEFAVPSASVRGRVMLIGDAQPGTLIGEIMRSFAMYKNFAVTLMHTHVKRAVTMQGFQKKGVYGANLVISSTLMGALALQLKEVVKGRDPRPMDTGDFWGAAMLQGGGLGIFGDFLFSDVNRFGGGLEQTFAGPVVSFADDLRRLTIGNALQVAKGEETKFGRELAYFLGRYTPGGSLWYARLGYERLLLDRLQLWADPGARRAFRREERRFMRDFDQKYWWRPGRPAPDRAPDVGNLAGG